MHPFLYRFMPSPAAGTSPQLGWMPVSRKGGRHLYQSLKVATKLIFLRFESAL